MKNKISMGIEHYQTLEHEAWSQMCKKLGGLLGMDQFEFNESKECREMIKFIEQWEWHNFQRRLLLSDNNSKYWDGYGTFWDGKELKA